MIFFVWYVICLSYILIKIYKYPNLMTTIIHIGSSKAASTFIQTHFQTLSDLYYFGIRINMQKFRTQGVGHTFPDEDCKKFTYLLLNLDRFKDLTLNLSKTYKKK